MTPRLHRAANDHLTLDFETVDTPLWSAIATHLESTLGFARVGHAVEGAGEGIHPDFRKGDVRLSAGWDEWSGDYLLANCARGDALLTSLFAVISVDGEFIASASIAWE